MSQLMRLFLAVSLGLVAATIAGSSGVRFDESEEPWFVDATVNSGLDFVHHNGMSGRLYYVEVVGGGGALFDYDNDGDLDLYLVQGHMLGADRGYDDALIPWSGERPPRDRLFQNRWVEDGRLGFVDVTEKSEIMSLGYGMGAAAADVDHDGWVDLYVLNFGKNELWRNLGDGRFSEVGGELGVDDPRWSVSASFADYDADGWLDLYVVNYLNYSFVAHKTCLTERGEPDYCLPGAYLPQADGLFRNLGAVRETPRFEDVSAISGIGAVETNGLGVVAADFDHDGRLDFYVANDLMPNNLWLQTEAGQFVDDGLISGAAVSGEGKAEASMGIAVGDYDADGDLDLFLAHFRRESNTLYRADSGLYRDATDELGLASPSWRHTSFGAGFLDYDNDGWLDLFVANGAVTFVPGADRSENPFPLDEKNQLFRNQKGKGFVDVTDRAGGALEVSEVSRAALLGDLDNDGDTDVVVVNNSGRAQVLVNQIGSTQGWLGARLVIRSAAATDSTGAARDALGAMVTLEREGHPTQARRVQTDGGYAGANDPRVLFGLGPRARSAAKLDLRVVWPDGAKEQFRQLQPNRYHLLLQGAGSKPATAGSAQ